MGRWLRASRERVGTALRVSSLCQRCQSMAHRLNNSLQRAVRRGLRSRVNSINQSDSKWVTAPTAGLVEWAAGGNAARHGPRRRLVGQCCTLNSTWYWYWHFARPRYIPMYGYMPLFSLRHLAELLVRITRHVYSYFVPRYSYVCYCRHRDSSVSSHHKTARLHPIPLFSLGHHLSSLSPRERERDKGHPSVVLCAMPSMFSSRRHAPPVQVCTTTIALGRQAQTLAVSHGAPA